MNARNFDSFLKASGVAGIREIAICYAYEADTTTFDVLAVRFRITHRAVRHCIEYAIINCVVHYDTAIRIKEKSHRNQLKHMKRNSVRTTADRFYDEVLRKRLAYVRNLPIKEVEEIAYLYMENPKMSCRELAKEFNLSSKELNLVLLRAITNNLVEEGVIRRIEVNSLLKCKTSSEFIAKCDYFKRIEMIRISNLAK